MEQSTSAQLRASCIVNVHVAQASSRVRGTQRSLHKIIFYRTTGAFSNSFRSTSNFCSAVYEGELFFGEPKLKTWDPVCAGVVTVSISAGTVCAFRGEEKVRR